MLHAEPPANVTKIKYGHSACHSFAVAGSTTEQVTLFRQDFALDLTVQDVRPQRV